MPSLSALSHPPAELATLANRWRLTAALVLVAELAVKDPAEVVSRNTNAVIGDPDTIVPGSQRGFTRISAADVGKPPWAQSAGVKSVFNRRRRAQRCPILSYLWPQLRPSARDTLSRLETVKDGTPNIVDCRIAGTGVQGQACSDTAPCAPARCQHLGADQSRPAAEVCRVVPGSGAGSEKRTADRECAARGQWE
jgi:hypothetical protein